MKRHTGRAAKGSQFQLQNLVNDQPQRLNQLLLSSSPSLHKYAIGNPVWVSPLVKDEYVEYQDRGFLEALGLGEFSFQLAAFWPRGGPVWDALATLKGKDGSHGVIILEAKSHLSELCGSNYACGAKGKSLEKITTSMNVVKRAVGVKPEVDWLGDYYQHANRIAHLYFLNAACEIPAWLVLLYFLGDIDQQGPMIVDEWIQRLTLLRSQMGIPKHHLLDERILPVFAHV